MEGWMDRRGDRERERERGGWIDSWHSYNVKNRLRSTEK